MYTSLSFSIFTVRVWNQVRGHSRLTLFISMSKDFTTPWGEWREKLWVVRALSFDGRCWRPHSETKTSEKSGALWELSTSTCGVYFAYFVYFVWVLFLIVPGTHCFTRLFFDSAEKIEPSSTHRHRPKIPPHGMVKQTEKEIPCLDLQNHSFFSHRPHERPFVPV